MKMTVDESIQFAIGFARQNLDHYRAGDWLNLRDDLKRFFGTEGIDVDPEEPTGAMLGEPDEDLSKVGEADLKKLQIVTRSFLSCFAGAEVSILPIINVSIRPRRIKHEDRTYSCPTAFGSLPDCMQTMLNYLLLVRPEASIELCPDCKQLFYRTGKMKFCSSTCTNRAMQKAKRLRDVEEKARRKSRKKGAK